MYRLQIPIKKIQGIMKSRSLFFYCYYLRIPRSRQQLCMDNIKQPSGEKLGKQYLIPPMYVTVFQLKFFNFFTDVTIRFAWNKYYFAFYLHV